MEKPYVAFAYPQYYPGGGWGDVVRGGTIMDNERPVLFFASADEALATAKKVYPPEWTWTYQVVDVTSGLVVHKEYIK